MVLSLYLKGAADPVARRLPVNWLRVGRWDSLGREALQNTGLRGLR
jgi:hypothetical protein